MLNIILKCQLMLLSSNAKTIKFSNIWVRLICNTGCAIFVFEVLCITLLHYQLSVHFQVSMMITVPSRCDRGLVV